MTAEQVESRLLKIETELADVRSRVLAGQPGRWWEKLPPPIDAGLLAELESRAKYFRQTGEYPPPDWKPGDAIPEPDHWQ